MKAISHLKKNVLPQRFISAKLKYDNFLSKLYQGETVWKCSGHLIHI